MPLIYYWRSDNYYRDLDEGASYHLNQRNSTLHELELGDSLWAFTRRSDGTYVLAAELIVKTKTFNPPSFEYGPYRIWGDLEKSRYFRLEGQKSIEPIIRSLSLKPTARYLGQAFQGNAAVRRIDSEAHLILAEAARNLTLEPRAHLLPE
ncbi:MAG TPA: hypothetical protein DCE42_13135 [Myxococcales bacterium]|nr:hypothetical protein [Deltaproteobacteria bacterium]MBU47818.1 hypothetical protein [Deltaproteobacteria bacterium]HAA55700.1 hypothetical protein [Myxococcales bacterium]